MTGPSTDQICAQIDSLGWKAGSVLPQNMLSSIQSFLRNPDNTSPQIDSNDWLIIISQTCDVVQRKLDREPFVEILHCQPQKQLRPDFQWRSTREVDFMPNQETHEEVYLTAHAIKNRYSIPRELLASHSPDPIRTLEGRKVIRLQKWYALRYTRPAWPDAFNNRISNNSKKKLEVALGDLSGNDVEVRIAIANKDRELGDAENYSIAIFFVVDQLAWEKRPDIREKASIAFNTFKTVLKDCNGILLNEELSELINGENFTWQQTKTTDEWNFANLSVD